MNESLIRWRKEDKQALRRAVTNFNSKIKRLERMGVETLPEPISYKELIKGKNEVYDEFGNIVEKRVFPILSRRELNRTINSLKRFSRRGAEKEVLLNDKVKVTLWEKKEITYQKRRATRNLNMRLQGMSRGYGMGREDYTTLEATKENLKNIEGKTGYDFNRLRKVLDNIASGDRALRHATIWQENFMYALSSMDGYENIDLLKEKVNSFENPIKLYEYIKDSEILQDLFLFYKDKATSQTFGGFSTNQEAFNRALYDLGLL